MNTKARPAKVTSSCIESSTASPIVAQGDAAEQREDATARKPTIMASPMFRLRTAFQTMMHATKATRAQTAIIDAPPARIAARRCASSVSTARPPSRLAAASAAGKTMTPSSSATTRSPGQAATPPTATAR